MISFVRSGRRWCACLFGKEFVCGCRCGCVCVCSVFFVLLCVGLVGWLWVALHYFPMHWRRRVLFRVAHPCLSVVVIVAVAVVAPLGSALRLVLPPLVFRSGCLPLRLLRPRCLNTLFATTMHACMQPRVKPDQGKLKSRCHCHCHGHGHGRRRRRRYLHKQAA